MSDLVKIARERIDDTRVTHWVGCERDHRECLIQRMADEIERLRAERDEHARWRRELANKLHDREAEISDAWIELRASGVQSERCLADGVAEMRKAVQHESDCVDAAKEHIETLRAALIAAMEIVQADRMELYYSCACPVTGKPSPEDDAALARYDAVISAADAALGSG